MTEARKREWRRGEYTVSTDRNRLDLHTIHDFIANHSYWAKGRSIETVQLALDNSLNFGLYKDQQQVGFARVVTDYAPSRGLRTFLFFRPIVAKGSQSG